MKKTQFLAQTISGHQLESSSFALPVREFSALVYVSKVGKEKLLYTFCLKMPNSEVIDNICEEKKCRES